MEAYKNVYLCSHNKHLNNLKIGMAMSFILLIEGEYYLYFVVYSSAFQ